MTTNTLELASRLIILSLYVIFIIFYIRHLKNNKAMQMNAEPLFSQKLFAAALMIPLVSFFTFGAIAWIGHRPQLDADGLNNFIEISKLPLAMLSMAVPLGVVVNNLHRTIQTSAQIYEAQRKNKNDLFYSHQKHTLEHISSLSGQTMSVKKYYGSDKQHEYSFAITKPLKLYKKIFTKMTPTEFNMTLSFQFRYFLIKLITTTNQSLKQIKNEATTNSADSLIKIAQSYQKLEKTLDRLAILLCIDTFYRNFRHERKYENEDLITQYSYASEIIFVIINYYNIAEDLCPIINFKNNIDFSYPFIIGQEFSIFSSIFESPDFKFLPNNDKEIGLHPRK
ncbi:hypothetical protein [Cronobacter turicensis]|uniref:hypothetical protein n=1 Tax=Cronobacter turicensis TaxID=413502 RepID=UPI003570A61F